jgi:NAD-reducing hydrogenase large subunit
MALAGADGAWEHYGGALRFVDERGDTVAEVAPERYQELIAEAAEPWSFMKFPYYRPRGYPEGIYRVGPLARLNICSHMGTPLADSELARYRERGGRIVTSSFFYHYARLIEVLAALERIGGLLDDPALDAGPLRAEAGINRSEGVGVSEAPRGTLFHHYRVDARGLITGVDLLVASGNNNLAMSRTVAQLAERHVRGPRIAEGALNRVEAGIRAYDPCLSCATHAVGMMPLALTLLGPGGEVLDERAR